MLDAMHLTDLLEDPHCDSQTLLDRDEGLRVDPAIELRLLASSLSVPGLKERWLEPWSSSASDGREDLEYS